MNDRFKFRVWDKRECRYIEAPSPTPLLQADGLLAYFTDHPEYMENYDVQFCTGLKDKNGKLIYEGDIVNVPCGNFIIKYCDNCKSFQCFYKDDCFACDGDYHWFELLDDLENLEIIGNIYENKELLNE